MGESCNQANSRTAGGHQLRNNNDKPHGSQATGRRQQPPPGGNPRQPNHPSYRNPQDLPVEDLRQKINEIRDARSIIDSRCREREVADPEGTDCSDRFLAFTARSTVTSTLRASSQLGSPSTMANKLLSNGYDVTLPP
jgi:hypothetical protein